MEYFHKGSSFALIYSLLKENSQIQWIVFTMQDQPLTFISSWQIPDLNQTYASQPSPQNISF